MTTISKPMYLLLMILLTMQVSGCGSSGSGNSGAVDTTSLQKGAVVQGPVEGATVFADKLDSGIRFVKDTGEISAPQTGADGSFILTSFPTYDFLLVSTGGTDTITGQEALLLLAPAGSAHITPLTTLVALDTTNETLDPAKGVRKKLEALMGGTSFDTNVSTNATPAILMLIKSAEAAVQSIRDAVDLAAIAAGKTLTPAQRNYIQAQAWQQIALALAGTSQNLAIPAVLDAALTTAITNAIAGINTANSNMTVSSTSATAIADASVDAALSALGFAARHASLSPLATTGVRTEISLPTLSSDYQTALNSNKTSLSVVIIGVTPSPFAPAPIHVISIRNAILIQIITGSGGGTGSVGIGVSW